MWCFNNSKRDKKRSERKNNEVHTGTVQFVGNIAIEAEVWTNAVG